MDVKKIDKNMDDNKLNSIDSLVYYNLNNDYLRGTAFNTGFMRLRDTDYVSEGVKTLMHHTSGINITFKTDSEKINIDAQVGGASYMSHMTAIGQIGFDLYVKVDGIFRFLSTTKINKDKYNLTLIEGLERKEREYRLYFPLYMSVKSAQIGILPNRYFSFVKEKQEKIVIYGTSISQGGCATRPGMSYTSIMERMSPYEYINLGFSGSAHLELEMADILNEINMKYLFLEVEANNTKEALMEKLPIFIERLKCEHIFLISHFPYTNVLIQKDKKELLDAMRSFQKKMPRVTFIDGDFLLANIDYDGTVDGVHLTDLGFFFVAKKLLAYIK